MSTHNICCPGEIRKILCGYPLLSVTMTFSYLLPDFIKQYSCRYGQKVLTFFFFFFFFPQKQSCGYSSDEPHCDTDTPLIHSDCYEEIHLPF